MLKGEKIIMAKILGTDELKDTVNFQYSKNTVLKESKELRKFNVLSFNALSRKKLEYGNIERRLCLYETQNGEKIYIQYPGKESADRKHIMPLDFRPELQMANGEFISDVSFGDIWDILSEIGKEQKKILPFVASIILRMGYMYGYTKESGLFSYHDIDILNNQFIDEGELNFEWYSLSLPEDTWFTLNDRIGEIRLTDNEVFSFEGFIKLVDLLFQNEDCKYYYKNVVLAGKTNYNFTNGRTQSSEANLLIINYLQDYTKLSELLNAFQKSRGVPGFKKQDYTVVTNGMVINIDTF